MSNVNYTIITNDNNKPTIIVHDEDGDIELCGVNSLTLKYSKRGRGKGLSFKVSMMVPERVNGEINIRSKVLTLPDDLEIVLGASRFCGDHGNLSKTSN